MIRFDSGIESQMVELTSSYSTVPSWSRGPNTACNSSKSLACTRGWRRMKKRIAHDEFDVVSDPAIKFVNAEYIPSYRKISAGNCCQGWI